VVFVNHVVTVHRISPEEIPEAEEKLALGVGVQSDHVLSRVLHRRWRRVEAVRIEASLEKLEFLEVNVDGVRPRRRGGLGVFEYPVLDRVPFYQVARRLTGVELAVDYPLPVLGQLKGEVRVTNGVPAVEGRS